jgi:DNA (cytosine-5)-methyltransferase 1
MLDIKGNELVRRVYDPSGLAPTLNTMQGGNRQPKIVESNTMIELGLLGDSGYEKDRRVYSDEGIAPTLSARDYKEPRKIMTKYRIRKLTPLECWRLMGFEDDDFNKCKEAKISDSQLYKMAGNSIVVDVLEAILSNLLGRGKLYKD